MAIQNLTFKNFILSALIFITVFLFTQKVWAVSFFLEAEKDYLKEKEITIKIKIDPKDDVVCTIDFDLIFNNENLEFIEFNLENSILSLWVNFPKFSENKIHFSGGIPNGFRGIFTGTPLKANELIEIKFKKKREISKEEIEKSFNLKSEVFLNNGTGESLRIEDFSFSEENNFNENFTVFSGILYNGIRWKIEKVF
jgi:hypothetical protein